MGAHVGKGKGDVRAGGVFELERTLVEVDGLSCVSLRQLQFGHGTKRHRNKAAVRASDAGYVTTLLCRTYGIHPGRQVVHGGVGQRALCRWRRLRGRLSRGRDNHHYQQQKEEPGMGPEELEWDNEKWPAWLQCKLARIEPSKLNGGAGAVKRAPLRRPREGTYQAAEKARACLIAM